MRSKEKSTSRQRGALLHPNISEKGPFRALCWIMVSEAEAAPESRPGKYLGEKERLFSNEALKLASSLGGDIKANGKGVQQVETQDLLHPEAPPTHTHTGSRKGPGIHGEPSTWQNILGSGLVRCVGVYF